MSKTSHIAAAAVVAIAAFAGACNRGDQTADRGAQAGAQARDVAREAARGVTDAAITTSIQARYFADDLVSGRNIDVDTNAGVVTLNGTVQNEQEKQRAIEIAREMDGVSQVRDRLQVGTAAASAAQPGAPPAPEAETAGRTPAWITTKIQAQYFVNPDIKPWNIDVTTGSDGTVTLRGEVDEASDRQKAVEIARATEGVTRVEDQLRLRGEREGEAVPTTGAAGEAPDTRPEAAPEEERPGAATEPIGEAAAPLGDAWLTAKIQSKYFLDDEVKGREIDVTTAGGRVTLTGVVGSEAERRQAVAIARTTDGVRDVEDRLRVDPSVAEEAVAPGSMGIGGVDNPFGDEWLQTKIQSKFFMDPAVKAEDIAVQVRAGVVTLTGQARSEDARRAAVEIARGTPGVKRVEDRIGAGQPR